MDKAIDMVSTLRKTAIYLPAMLDEVKLFKTKEQLVH